MNSKKSIRNYYLKLRLALSPSEFSSLNQNLRTTFFSSIELFDVSTLHTFFPMAKGNEPNTWLIIDRLKKEFPKIRISIPKMNGSELINYYFEGTHQIAENKWGIPEPQFGEVTLTEKIDLVIVPLLAFDRQGNRVGYGKGFYDRFLSQCCPDCKKVGLSFFDPVDEISGIKNHDVKLTHCITPTKFYSF